MGVITDILSVFTEVGSWFASAVQNLIPMFYVASGDNAGLTFLGALSVASLSIAITTMLIRVIGDFIGFRRG